MSALDLSELIEQGRVPRGTLLLSVEVDLSRLLSEMILLGRYGNAERAIMVITEERFPIHRGASPSCYRTNVLVVPPYRNNILLEAQVEEMEKRYLGQHGFDALLAVGAQYPDLQRTFDLFALGSLWNESGGRRTPWLSGNRSVREVSVLRSALDEYQLTDGQRCIAYLR